MIKTKQLLAAQLLIWQLFPARIKNLLRRPQMLLRIAVAINAPAHLQIHHPHLQRHLPDIPVTSRAANTICDMHRVIKINIIRQIMYTRPCDWHTTGPTLPHRIQQRRMNPHLRVTIHARLHRRNSCNRRDFRAGVAVTAIDAQALDVMFVAEGNGLLDKAQSAGGPIRPGRAISQCSATAYGKQWKANNHQPGEQGLSGCKKLRHESSQQSKNESPRAFSSNLHSFTCFHLHFRTPDLPFATPPHPYQTALHPFAFYFWSLIEIVGIRAPKGQIVASENKMAYARVPLRHICDAEGTSLIIYLNLYIYRFMEQQFGAGLGFGQSRRWFGRSRRGGN